MSDYLTKKGELVNSIRQRDNMISFNSSSPRFAQDKQIQIITGQDPESGNLYIIKDDKSNLGPGYYKNADDIKQMKAEFTDAVNKNRQKHGAFGSSTGREVGSNINNHIASNSYQGVAGQYYDSVGQSSVVKKTHNTRLRE